MPDVTGRAAKEVKNRLHNTAFASGPWRANNISNRDDSPVAIELGPSRIVLPKHEARILGLALMSLTEES